MRNDDGPGRGTLSSGDPPASRPPPAPATDRKTLDQLLEWVAVTPDDGLDDMRTVLDHIQPPDDLVNLLSDAVFELPVRDVGWHLLILSVIGQLQAPSSIEVLEKFLWLSDADVLGPESATSRGACDFAAGGMLQARAAEMLIWVAAPEQDDWLRRILADHPSSLVRIATIDSWLYGHGDDGEAIEQIRQMSRDEDGWAVGLPRYTEDLDPDEFERQVNQLVEHYADAPAQLPERAAGDPDVH